MPIKIPNELKIVEAAAKYTELIKDPQEKEVLELAFYQGVQWVIDYMVSQIKND